MQKTIRDYKNDVVLIFHHDTEFMFMQGSLGQIMSVEAGDTLTISCESRAPLVSYRLIPLDSGVS